MFNAIRTTGQLGPILKRLRKDKGWSQIEFGKRIGLSQERISVIESFPEKMSLDQLLTVLMALDAELQVVPRNTILAPEPENTECPVDIKPKLRETW
jgi:HTH-type transcriptional regulator/antitoxin HipB